MAGKTPIGFCDDRMTITPGAQHTSASPLQGMDRWKCARTGARSQRTSAARKILAPLERVLRPDHSLSRREVRFTLHRLRDDGFHGHFTGESSGVKIIKIAPYFMLIAALGISSSGAPFRETASASTVTATSGPAWTWPLAPPHRILGGYVAPLSRYSAGHRGIDLAADTTDRVFAPEGGVVSFAGTVVDRGVISLAIDGDYIASIEPVTPLVATGERVVRGQLIAEVSAGGHCDHDCIHFGVRLHGNYVSPLVLLGVVPRAVLLPLE